MADDKIHFGTLHPDGSVTNEQEMEKDTIRQCPHLIMWPTHYREDGTCKCDDPNDTDMPEWGYTWNEKIGRCK